MSIHKSNLVLIAILSLAFVGIYNYTAPTAVHGAKVVRMSAQQGKHQKNVKLSKHVKKQVKHSKKHKKHDWYADGLSKRQQSARAKVVYLESRGEWNATNGTCWGRFQLRASYLGYKHGHVNLNHYHQTKTADKYVQDRYGTWTRAYHFHLNHGWY